MANEEQLSILKQGVEVWNRWRKNNPAIEVNLIKADLRSANLSRYNLTGAYLRGSNLSATILSEIDLSGANLTRTNLSEADLRGANFSKAFLRDVNFSYANFAGAKFLNAQLEGVLFAFTDLSKIIDIENIVHLGPSSVGMETIANSHGRIPEVFLRGCGLSNWQIEQAKLYNPDLSNEEINNIQYKIYDLRASQALQISPLFISYSHADSAFVDKLENYLNEKGVRFWRDIHEMKAGRVETQIDQAINQNRTLLLVLSKHSTRSDWVEHEVRLARELEKETGRDVLCPVALDNIWKESHWPKRIIEQIREYNVLDFSQWQDDSKFEGMFHRLIDGLELFYKG